MTTLAHYVNNRWTEGSGGSFSSVNPATGEELWKGRCATGPFTDEAVAAARAAFPKWAALPLKTRIQYLEKFRDVVKKEQDKIAETISKETGKPKWEAKTEVESVINKVQITLEAYDQRCPQTTKQHPLGQLITRHRPHGVVLVLGPFNFPAHITHGHIFPALLSGNTVIFKPSEYTPLTSIALMHCWEQCELPPGVLNMIQGYRDVGQMLVKQPEIDGIYFTGSWNTGRSIAEAYATQTWKILALEMGGNNALVVHRISDVKAAVYNTIQSAFLTAGQRCTCARRLIVTNTPTANAFMELLLETTKKIKVGAYTDSPEPFMGPVISAQAAKKLLEVQASLAKRGCNPMLEMSLLKESTGLLSPGIMNVTPLTHRPDDEFFGPFLQVIRVPDFSYAIAEANQTGYGLTASLLSDHEEDYQIFLQQVQAGVINWNVPTTNASSEAPFGGIKRSGNHRPSGSYAVDYCSYPIASIEAKKVSMPKTISPGISI